MTADAEQPTVEAAEGDASPPAQVYSTTTTNPAATEATSFPTRIGFGVSIHQQGLRNPDALTARLSDRQLSQVITQAAAEDLRKHEERMLLIRSTMYLLAGSLVVVIVLCWLFLYYQKSELITPIITAILGAAGGFGVGRSTAPKKPRDED